jgi:hypothetical protein
VTDGQGGILIGTVTPSFIDKNVPGYRADQPQYSFIFNALLS